MNCVKKAVIYLKDPQLVADFQYKLGIQPVYRNAVREENKKCLNTDIDFESNSRKKGKSDKLSEDEANTDKEETLYRMENHGDSKNFCVRNKFLYYFFYIGTYLGDEIFYSIYFPFWFWNIDYNVGRRIITVWAVVMYIGQSMKDVIQWPRPSCPPAIRVQSKWSLEYGMPSTHAMIAVAIPMASILFTIDKFNYPVSLAATVAMLICVWVCTSRIYLGMHTVLDVLVGVGLATSLLAITVPMVRNFDSLAVTWKGTPLVILAVTVCLVIFYPNCDQWTPTRGDTTTVLGCITGIYTGAAIINEFMLQQEPPQPILVDYLVSSPGLQKAGIYGIRFLAGILIIILLEILLASAWHTVDRCLGLDPNESRLQRKQRLPGLDLTYKYLTYLILGLTVALLPLFLTVGFGVKELL